MRLLNKDQQNVCCFKYSNYIFFFTVFNTSFLIMFVDLLSSDLLSQRRDGQMECFCLSPPLSHSSSVITCISSIFWMDRPSSFISTFLPSFFCPTPLLLPCSLFSPGQSTAKVFFEAVKNSLPNESPRSERSVNDGGGLIQTPATVLLDHSLLAKLFLYV